MIRELLHQYGTNNRRIWDYDRRGSVGSSEIGQCIRKTGYSKWDIPPDEGYQDGWGYQIRGTVIEEHYCVPAIRASLPEGARLLYAGEEQQTLMDGYLSGTPDGVITGLKRDCLASLPTPVPDIGPSRCLGLEIKSIDPRKRPPTGPDNLHHPQVNTALGLVRKFRQEQPDYGVIVYIDASDWSVVYEFAIRFDQRMFDDAQNRALQIMTAWDETHPANLETRFDPNRLLPEGKLSGGGECRYCAWAKQCQGDSLAAMPADRGNRLPKDAAAELKLLRDSYVQLDRAAQDNLATQEIAKEAVKQFLRMHDVRAHKEVDGSWSVVWSTSKGRMSVDMKALEASGFDLEPYRKEGSPSERLTIK